MDADTSKARTAKTLLFVPWLVWRAQPIIPGSRGKRWGGDYDTDNSNRIGYTGQLRWRLAGMCLQSGI